VRRISAIQVQIDCEHKRPELEIESNAIGIVADQEMVPDFRCGVFFVSRSSPDVSSASNAAAQDRQDDG
jgi:hypothetical protein